MTGPWSSASALGRNRYSAQDKATRTALGGAELDFNFSGRKKWDLGIREANSQCRSWGGYDLQRSLALCFQATADMRAQTVTDSRLCTISAAQVSIESSHSKCTAPTGSLDPAVSIGLCISACSPFQPTAPATSSSRFSIFGRRGPLTRTHIAVDGLLAETDCVLRQLVSLAISLTTEPSRVGIGPREHGKRWKCPTDGGSAF